MDEVEKTDEFKSLYKDLMVEYGPMIYGSDLPTVLGYRSVHAYQKAVVRKTLPVTVFKIPNRKDRYVLTKDVAKWLVKSKSEGAINSQEIME